MIEEVLCVIEKDGEILLGKKKRGFGEGKWNGFGGKIEEGESLEDALKREVKEECGLDVSKAEKVAELTFYFDEDKEIKVHTYKAVKWYGEVTESEEMKPRWFNVNEIPYDEMWEDDKYWLPLVLNGQKIKAKFYFENDRLFLSIIDKWK